MKIYRYMNKNEFMKLLASETLKHDCHKFAAKTDSVGFCFLPESVEFESDGELYDYDAWYCLRFLSSVVCDEVLVEFAVPYEKQQMLKEGYGVYADPCNEAWGATIDIAEYSTPEYNYTTLVPTRAFPWYSRYEGVCLCSWFNNQDNIKTAQSLVDTDIDVFDIFKLLKEREGGLLDGEMDFSQFFPNNGVDAEDFFTFFEGLVSIDSNLEEDMWFFHDNFGKYCVSCCTQDSESTEDDVFELKLADIKTIKKCK